MHLREAAIIIGAAAQHLGWCGCGMPGEAAAWLRRALAAHSTYVHAEDQATVFGDDDGRACVLRYLLDRAGFTEHGGSIYGAWLTERGEKVLLALQVEAAIEAWRADAGHDLYKHQMTIVNRWRSYGLGADGTRF